VGSGAHKTCLISKTVQDRSMVTITDLGSPCALSIGAKFIDLGWLWTAKTSPF